MHLSGGILFLGGATLGYLVFWFKHIRSMTHFERLGGEIIQRAEMETEIHKKNSELELQRLQAEKQKEFEASMQRGRKKLSHEEERLKQREDKLESRMNLVETKLTAAEKREAVWIARKEQLKKDQEETGRLKAELWSNLEKISGWTAEEAKQELFQNISNELRQEKAGLVRKSLQEAQEECDQKAASIITTAISRLAVATVSDVTAITVPLPHEDMKGRIIGREGRNIRALESATGVNILIDDTPGAIVITGFDPIRKQIAKTALQDLLADGRIHPSRIEETVEKATVKVDGITKKYGEDAAFRAGASDLHPELILLLGQLKYRYSYGQNVLEHSLEVSQLMGLMAAELGLDISVSKRIGLLHDIGKALSHKSEGSHATVGHNWALNYGESKKIANGIGCHHDEIPPISPEAWLCCAADRISASRPGARIEAVEEYVKRLCKLEKIAMSFEGIESAYALHAGREVRVLVKPQSIDGNSMAELARNLSKQIEKELNYPGKIKITAIREQRAVAYAL